MPIRQESLFRLTKAFKWMMPKPAGGGSYTIALKFDGTAHAWRYNTYGELGTGRPRRALHRYRQAISS